MPIQRVKPKFSDVRNVSIAASTMPAGTIIQTVVQQEDGTTSFTASGTPGKIFSKFGFLSNFFAFSSA